jgi:hypothetical protein
MRLLMKNRSYTSRLGGAERLIPVASLSRGPEPSVVDSLHERRKFIMSTTSLEEETIYPATLTAGKRAIKYEFVADSPKPGTEGHSLCRRPKGYGRANSKNAAIRFLRMKA